MKLVTFDPLRTWDIPGATYIKPSESVVRRQTIMNADWLLFPEYWQINFLHYGWKKQIFPSISSYHLGHDKIEMTRAFEAICPANVPETAILPATPESCAKIMDRFGFPVVLKHVRSSMGRGVYRLETKSELLEFAAGVPVLYAQECLPIDRDLRVVVIGAQVVAAYWRIGRQGEFHNNVSRGGRVSFEGIPEDALTLVSKLAQTLGIDHAGFDVAMVSGWCYLLEFNVIFGNAALNERGISTGRLIHKYLSDKHPFPNDPSQHFFPKAG